MKDYKQLTDGDLDLSLGDLQVTESTEQHKRDILLSDKGHIRDKSEAGVGIFTYLLDNEPEDFLRATRLEYSSDGMSVKKVALTDKYELEVDAEYENS
ncbi:MAG: hypothetical protein R3Y50_06110 [Rikenellaceae bacterium]